MEINLQSKVEVAEKIRILKKEIVDLEMELERTEPEPLIDENGEPIPENYYSLSDRLSSAINERQEELHKLQEALKEAKNFNRQKCLNNLKVLIEAKGIKIGDIEKEANVTLGYLSRLRSDKISADPSIEFLVTAAKMLGVSLNQLIDGDFSAISPTEQLISEVISSLIADTKSDDVTWIKETVKELKNVSCDDQGDTSHPLFRMTLGVGGFGYPEPIGAEYNSRFLTNDDVVPCGNFYHAALPTGKKTVYITRVNTADGDLDTESYEMYMMDSVSNIKPICATSVCCDRLKADIINLYREIEIASSHVHIDDDVRGALKEYLEYTNLELPFN